MILKPAKNNIMGMAPNDLSWQCGYQVSVDGKAPQQYSAKDEIVGIGRDLMVGSDPFDSLVSSRYAAPLGYCSIDFK